MLSIVEILGLFVLVNAVVRGVLWVYCTCVRRLDLRCYQAKDGQSWALVTGATAGIGFAFADILLQQGFAVLITGRDECKLQTTLRELADKYPDATIDYVVSDATDLSPDNFQAVIDKIKDKDLSILVNNAGISHSQWKLHHLETDSIMDSIKVNAVYPTLLTKNLLPYMGFDRNEKRKKLVIFVTSFSALAISNPFASVYGATKAYARSLCKSLSEEYSESSIRFLSANFGYVSTKMSRMTKNIFASEPYEAVYNCLRMHDQVDAAIHLKDFQFYLWNHIFEVLLLDRLPCLFFRLVAYYRTHFDKLRGKRYSAIHKQVTFLEYHK